MLPNYESTRGRWSALPNGWLSLQASQQEGDINTSNVVVSLVSKDTNFTLLEGSALEPFIALLEQDQADNDAPPADAAPEADAAAAAPVAAAEDAPAAGDDAAPMEG